MQPQFFADRAEAAEALSTELLVYRGRNPLILAIPRGAVPMGKIVAERLDGELDVVMVRKLGAPLDPEFAIGAIDEAGCTYLGPFAEREHDLRAYLAEEKTHQLEIIRK
ncbi:MAG TPA: phosphoribosyltransferase family protein, partial [Burkholderiaceae bacterium]|nr:phosphoribosyltransferase family protein [Burkholderiaceae bacterium]